MLDKKNVKHILKSALLFKKCQRKLKKKKRKREGHKKTEMCR